MAGLGESLAAQTIAFAQETAIKPKRFLRNADISQNPPFSIPRTTS
jgi:hypothetical protein